MPLPAVLAKLPLPIIGSPLFIISHPHNDAAHVWGGAVLAALAPGAGSGRGRHGHALSRRRR